MTDIGKRDLIDFEKGIEGLSELARNPSAGDFILSTYFRSIAIETDDQLVEAYAAVQGERPDAAEMIRQEFALLYQFKAVCVIEDINPDVFFPEDKSDTDAARAVCNRCSVRQECLDFALTYEEEFGFWGGKSEDERREILEAQS